MNYYAKRLTQFVVVLWASITITFVLYRMMPMGPAEMMRIQFIQSMTEAGQSVDQEALDRVNRQVEAYIGMNPDESTYEAYINYMHGIIFELDFGHSITHNQPVFDLLFDAMPWSIFLSVYGLAFGTTTALILGAGMAYTEGSKFDTGMTIFTLLNTTIPYYIYAIVLLIIFGYGLGWFPVSGRYVSGTEPGLNIPFMRGVIWHATLPIASSFIAGFGGALAYRGNCIREMGKGYIRVARLRGVKESRLAMRYVGRNALLPIYTGIMMGLAGIFGSSVILEIIFNYRAVGLITFDALIDRNYPLLMGSFIFFTVLTLIGLLIADLTYGIIDPRVRGGDEREAF